jgi:hypothetical protein
MQSWWSVGLLALSGCSQIFGLSSPVLDDASHTDTAEIMDASRDAQPDSPVGLGTCVQKWLAGPTLSTPVSPGVNTTSDEQWPFVTADGLELYYSKDGEVTLATRTTTTSNFGSPTKVGSLSSGSPEGKTFVSSNKLRAFFASARAASTGGFDIFRGSRNTAGGNFNVDQTYLGSINTASNDFDPHLTDDLLHLYYTTVINATQVIVLSTRATVNDNFGAPVIVPDLTAGNGTDNGPTLTANELVIVFASTRLSSLGATNLWYATRPNTSAPFGTPQLVPNVNSNAFDDTPHLTADGCTLYFSSTGTGSFDLYMSKLQ